jgi:hypothetical protein
MAVKAEAVSAAEVGLHSINPQVGEFHVAFVDVVLLCCAASEWR